MVRGWLSNAGRERLLQARLQREPRLRALWRQLAPEQQALIVDPSMALGHSYPLTSAELARLTSLSARKVRYWADAGLIPHWREGAPAPVRRRRPDHSLRRRRHASERGRFYRAIVEEPLEAVAARMAIIASLLLARLAEKPDEAEALRSLGFLPRSQEVALHAARGAASSRATRLQGVARRPAPTALVRLALEVRPLPVDTCPCEQTEWAAGRRDHSDSDKTKPLRPQSRGRRDRQRSNRAADLRRPSRAQRDGRLRLPQLRRRRPAHRRPRARARCRREPNDVATDGRGA
jgi:hypothetical protein